MGPHTLHHGRCIASSHEPRFCVGKIQHYISTVSTGIMLAAADWQWGVSVLQNACMCLKHASCNCAWQVCAQLLSVYREGSNDSCCGSIPKAGTSCRSVAVFLEPTSKERAGALGAFVR